MEELVIEEMIDMLFFKKWRKRVKYDFAEKRRNDFYFRYHNGEYLDHSIIKYNVNKMFIDDIFTLIIKEGGGKKSFFIVCGESGIMNTKDALVSIFNDGMGGLLYAGNGVGYFQGEQYIGPPERYILVNTKKKGNPCLFE